MTDINTLIANNLADKDSMKVSLSHSDAGAVQHSFQRAEKLNIKISQIKYDVIAINDSFYLNHATNSQMDVSVLDDRRTTTTSIVVTSNI